MKAELRVPKIIETKDPIKLVNWYVKDGDFVSQGSALCMLETSKASMEIPAEKTGYIKLLKKEGDYVLVDEPICAIADTLGELGV